MNRETLIDHVTSHELDKIFNIIIKSSLEGSVYVYHSFGHYERVHSDITPEFSQIVVDNVFTILRNRGYTILESHDNLLLSDRFKISW